jgi:uncharacterized protein involved in exopolysaccharide biosynthesis
MWSGESSLEQTLARLRAIGAALLKRGRWGLAAGTAAGAALALLYVALFPAQFIARVSVALAPRAIANDGPEDVRHYHQIALDSEQAETEVAIMTSERLLRPVFEQLSLAQSAELQRGSDGFWEAAARFAGRLAPDGGAYDERERAYFAFASRLLCLRLGLSYVFTISYRSHDPALAARVVNAVAAQYLSNRIDREKARRVSTGSGAYAAARWDALTRQGEIGRAAAANGVAPSEDMPAAAARVLGEAVAPLRKSYPSAGPTLALGAFLGLILSALAILAFGVDEPADRRREPFTNA